MIITSIMPENIHSVKINIIISGIIIHCSVLQVINFYFVPSHLRVTYVNVVTLFWTVYLSYMKHKVWTRKFCTVDHYIVGVKVWMYEATILKALQTRKHMFYI